MGRHSEAFLRLVEDAKTRVKTESAEEALARLDEHPDAKLVDVREESEWERDHLDEAIHLGKGIIERDVDKMFPDRETELHLYCGGGYRSALAADNLMKMGYTNAISVDGGYRGLMEALAKLAEDDTQA